MIEQLKQMLCTLTLLLLLVSSTNAQDEEDYGELVHQPKLAIKFAPFPLISTTPAFQMGVEVKTFNLQGVQLELGYISSKILNMNSDFDGIKIKTEYRFYRKLKNRHSNIRFAGLQHMYKSFDVETTATVWRENRTYQETMPLKVKNRVNSVFLVGGFASKIANNFYFELALGLGGRFLNLETTGIPEDAEFTSSLSRGIFNPISEEGKYRFMDVFVSVKVAYFLGAK